jgi:lysophospholipid acyltransferase (LPLAT)-like uncharacterized protein
MLREGQVQQGHLAVTPDGPRGPRRRVKPGLIYLASQTGLPIIAGGLAYTKAWRLHSWDRFVLPCPWSRVECVVCEAIRVPANIDRAELDRYCEQVEQAMDRATEEAERLAARGRAKAG